MNGGAAFGAGQYSGWTPIGAVQTAGGYDVAWKFAGGDQYTVWITDSNGNYISDYNWRCVRHQHAYGIS